MRITRSISLFAAVIFSAIVALWAAEPARAAPTTSSAIATTTAPIADVATTRLTLPQSLGAALKGYRTSFALTQAQLAAAAGVSATRISRLERGLDTASTLEADRLVGALDSIVKVRFDPAAESRITTTLLRVRTARRLAHSP